MRKNIYYLFGFILFALAVISCASYTPFYIDYLEPAELTITNSNHSTIGFVNIVTSSNEKEKEINTLHLNRKQALDDMAIAIANKEYFEAVLINDSTYHHITPISRSLIEEISNNMGVDYLITLEGLASLAKEDIEYDPIYNTYVATLNTYVRPDLKIYSTKNGNLIHHINTQEKLSWDSFELDAWERGFTKVTMSEVEKALIALTSEILVKQITPFWVNAERIVFSNSTAKMRDANLFIKENNPSKARELWMSEFHSISKNTLLKSRIACNISLSYEIEDNFNEAVLWIKRAENALPPKYKDQLNSERTTSTHWVIDYMKYYTKELQRRKLSFEKLQQQTKNVFNDF